MSEKKKCPGCAEDIQADALKCRHCGTLLIPPEWQQVAAQWRCLPELERNIRWNTLSLEQQTMLQNIMTVLPATPVPTPAAMTSSMGNPASPEKSGVSPILQILGAILAIISGILIMQAIMQAFGLWQSLAVTVLALVGFIWGLVSKKLKFARLYFVLFCLGLCVGTISHFAEKTKAESRTKVGCTGVQLPERNNGSAFMRNEVWG